MSLFLLQSFFIGLGIGALYSTIFIRERMAALKKATAEQHEDREETRSRMRTPFTINAILRYGLLVAVFGVLIHRQWVHPIAVAIGFFLAFWASLLMVTRRPL